MLDYSGMLADLNTYAQSIDTLALAETFFKLEATTPCKYITHQHKQWILMTMMVHPAREHKPFRYRKHQVIRHCWIVLHRFIQQTTNNKQ
jgi:hypothetical protein